MSEWTTAVISDHDVATPALLCPTRGFGVVLYGISVPIINPSRAWKPLITTLGVLLWHSIVRFNQSMKAQDHQ